MAVIKVKVKVKFKVKYWINDVQQLVEHAGML